MKNSPSPLLRRIIKKRRYKKDEKLMKQRGLDMKKLDNVVYRLASGKALDAHEKDHQLKGSAMEYRECHVMSDWLLVYRLDDDRVILELFRTGNHSDIFSL